MSEPYMFAEAYDLDTELGRLKLVESLNDPFTIRNLQATGVTSGWRCLEVGAGAGSMTRWLAAQVAPTGSVTAVDIRTVFLQDLADNKSRRRVGGLDPADPGDRPHAKSAAMDEHQHNAHLG